MIETKPYPQEYGKSIAIDWYDRIVDRVSDMIARKLITHDTPAHKIIDVCLSEIKRIENS